MLAWKADCPWCAENVPLYQEIANVCKAKNIRVIAVFAPSRRPAREILERNALAVDIVKEADGRRFGLDRVPAILLLSPDGKIENIRVGRLTPEQSDAVLARLREKECNLQAGAPAETGTGSSGRLPGPYGLRLFVDGAGHEAHKTLESPPRYGSGGGTAVVAACAMPAGSLQFFPAGRRNKQSAGAVFLTHIQDSNGRVLRRLYRKIPVQGAAGQIQHLSKGRILYHGFVILPEERYHVVLGAMDSAIQRLAVLHRELAPSPSANGLRLGAPVIFVRS